MMKFVSEKYQSFVCPQASLLFGSLVETLKFRYERNHRPRSLLLAVTYNCNMRCKMCNIWKTKNADELTSDELISALKRNKAFLSKLRWVQITGGEPSLKRAKVQSVVRTILEICPNLASIGFPTNGYLTEEVSRMTKQALDDILSLKLKTKLQVHVSLDGSSEIHDSQRGVAGSYAASLATIGLLKKLERESNLFRVALECTVTPINISKLAEVYNIARELDCEIYFTPAITSDVFYRNKELTEKLGLQDMVNRLESFYKSILRMKHSDPFLRYYMNYFYEEAINVMKGNTRRIPCTAGRGWLFVNPQGLVYPCHIAGQDLGLGNIGKIGSQIYFANSRTVTIRLKASKKCGSCMENCGLGWNVQLNVNAFLAYLTRKQLFPFLSDYVRHIST